MLYTLEIVVDFERLQRKIDVLQEQFPDLAILAKTQFYAILGCPERLPLNDLEKAWLEKQIENKIMLRYRCKGEKEY